MTKLKQRMVEELQRRNYSPATIRGYVLAIKQFADYFGKPPDRLGATHVQRFQWYLLQERKLAPVTVEIRMSALRFFFKKMLKRRDIHFDDLPFPKVPRKLPTVLSPDEVSRMIEGTTNLMHRTILMVLYATGVRRTERAWFCFINCKNSASTRSENTACISPSARERIATKIPFNMRRGMCRHLLEESTGYSRTRFWRRTGHMVRATSIYAGLTPIRGLVLDTGRTLQCVIAYMT